MAMDDLFAAMKMFKEGVNEYQLKNAIEGANQRVQEAKANLSNEAEQRTALQGISNELVTQMSALGAPAATIQQVSGAVGPKQFADANAMHREALQAGNTGLRELAVEQQEFETNPKMLLAQAKAVRAADPLAQMRFEEGVDKYNTSAMRKFTEEVDNTHAVRSAFGRTGQGIQRANALQTLVGKAGESVAAANKIPPQMVYEMALGLASMVKGGTATDQDAEHFAVKSVGMDKAKAKQYLTNGVQGADAGEFIQMYLKTVKRERAEMQLEAEETVLGKAQGNLKLYKRLPDEDKNIWKQQVADRIGVPAEQLIVDEAKGTVTTTVREENRTKVFKAAEALKAAYKDIKGQDATAKAKAVEVFRRLGIDPNQIPVNQAIQDVKFKITRGLF